ncbi:MAG: hypothetical protein LBS31_00330, partial [Candidatus Adiutrix sp.]|nr:hypothetical protein [Candidatus Adiutrix sp.]
MDDAKIKPARPSGAWRVDILTRFKPLFDNPMLAAIREGLSFSLPVIVAGTMAILFNSFPLPAYQGFMVNVFGEGWKALGGYIWNGTLGVMSIVMAISIANSLSEQYNA